MNKRLTIGMAVYNDFHGMYFTIQALRVYHPMCKSDDIEFIVLDNNPKHKDAASIQTFLKQVKNARYIPYNKKTSTSVRNEVFNNAKGKYTLCLDCHVLIYNDGLKYLLEYYENNPDCKNIIHGPLVNDHLNSPAYSHMDPIWGEWMYGKWRTNLGGMASNKPFVIPMQGLGLFSCETKNWLGFNELFKGFGGEEGYIHEKFRQNGGEAICIPQLKWVHRFGRPEGPPYPNKAEDRIWNYFIGWLELTKNPEDQMIKDIYNTFKSKTKNIDSILEEAKKATGI